ncbi:hypothetical protein N7520_009652 [Penicillium odoratum]|uniref:uncharacterized protein n=1 Tax=Penicillium odoratum TaxID=1167516 RepID=UPI002546FB08|nr:uncharacterized protein N7520_009652 [Penicillium odoratum]KAJ5752735.1 hypothetical protein N7520_009652 [Penicillium odoratum]
MIFESIATNEFGVFIGPQDLTANNVMNLTTPMLDKCFRPGCTFCDFGEYTWNQFSSEIAAGNFTRISLAECIDIIEDSNAAGTKALMILVENLSVKDGGNRAIQYSSHSGLPDASDKAILSTTETTGSDKIKVDGLYFYKNVTSKTSGDDDNFACVSPVDIAYDESGYGSYGDVYSTNTAQGCIRIPTEEKCELLYSPTIAIIVSLCSLVKVVAMFFAARISRFRSAPLLTLGDAVVSFMKRPDPTTDGMCWISQSDVSRGVWRPLDKSKGMAKRALFRRSSRSSRLSKDRSISFEILEESEPYDVVRHEKFKRRKWYMQVPSKKRWAGTLLLCVSYISVAGFLLKEGIKSENGSGVLSTRLLSEWWSEGLSISNYNIFFESGSMIGTVMFANIPQLWLTVSYYWLNKLITDMLSAAEYNSYGITRKPLRVSRPVKGSQQRSTYWLSIPYQYSVPLLLLHVLLHWLISQSLCYILGEANYSDKLSAVGWSPLPTFLAILVGSLLVLLMILLGCKRFKSNMPLAGGCSAAISAACHPPWCENLDTATLGPVRWGQTIEPPNRAIGYPGYMMDEDQGHYSFTALDTVNATLTKL